MKITSLICNPKEKISKKEIYEMAESIADPKVGLLEPILIDPETMEVKVGRTRYFAMKQISPDIDLIEGKHFIFNDKETNLIAFVENFRRKKLTLAQEMEYLEELLKANNITALASAIGQSDVWVRRRLNLKKLNKEFKSAMKDNECPKWGIMHYEFVASFEKGDQNLIYYNIDDFSEMTIQKFKAEVSKKIARDLSELPWESNGCGKCSYCKARVDQDDVLFEEMKTNLKLCSNTNFINKEYKKWIEEVKGEGLTQVTESYYSQDDEIITQDYFEEVEKDGEEAIFINGERIGEKVLIKRRKNKAGNTEKAEKKTLADLKESKMRQRYRHVASAIEKAITEDTVKCTPEQALHMVFIYNTDQVIYHYDGKPPMKTKNVGIKALKEVAKKTKEEKTKAMWAMVKIPLLKDLRQNNEKKQVIEEFCELFNLNLDALWEEAMTELPDPKSWIIRKAQEKENAKVTKTKKSPKLQRGKVS